MVWYSHLFLNFPQFIVMHTVKGFGIVNKAEIDVFLELSFFFHDPADGGNLISGSSAFSKTSLNIWKFMVHILIRSEAHKQPGNPMTMPLKEAHRRLPSIPNMHTSGAEGLKVPLPLPPKSGKEGEKGHLKFGTNFSRAQVTSRGSRQPQVWEKAKQKHSLKSMRSVSGWPFGGQNNKTTITTSTNI